MKKLTFLGFLTNTTFKVFFQESVPESQAVRGAVIAIQTFRDFLEFNLHCHILITDGCFYGNGMFRVAPTFDERAIMRLQQ